MSAEIICDGCGKREPMVHGPHGQWLKPREWFQRSDQDGIQAACSRRCIDRIAEQTGKTGLVSPV